MIRHVHHAIAGTLTMYPNDGTVWGDIFEFNATEFSHAKTSGDK